MTVEAWNGVIQCMNGSARLAVPSGASTQTHRRERGVSGKKTGSLNVAGGMVLPVEHAKLPQFGSMVLSTHAICLPPRNTQKCAHLWLDGFLMCSKRNALGALVVMRHT